MSINRGLSASLVLAGLMGVGVAATPAPAQAWWRGGWCCGVRVGLFVPPIVVAPPIYAPAPVYYPPPRPWIPPHWQGGYWIPGHWG